MSLSGNRGTIRRLRGNEESRNRDDRQGKQVKAEVKEDVEEKEEQDEFAREQRDD